MEKDLIFFGEGGITDTQANRIADFAKLSYTDEESFLSSMNFLDETVETINGTVSKHISYGLTDLSTIDEHIKRIGDLKGLCAWLREAISAHQRLLDEVKKCSFEDYCRKNNVNTLPQLPEEEANLTEDDIISSFDVKKRNRYYYLEAQCATIGKLIHKNCAIDLARKKYYEKLSNPIRVTGTGSDTLIYTYTPSVTKEELEAVFSELQEKHAKYQSELNAIKSEIKSRMTNDAIEKSKKYECEYKDYQSQVNVLYNEFNSWKAEESKRVSALKIIIPNSLKETFDRIEKFGKP